MFRSFFAACVAVVLVGVAPLDAAERPNIVFILIDDLAHDALGHAGRYPFLKTPHIDQLAREGGRFTNAFVTMSLCSPSRASFLSGQHAHTHGVINNRGLELDPQIPTFPQELQRAGYATAYVGKWHMNHSSDPRPGFDYWLSFSGQGVYFDPPLNENGRQFKATGYMTDLLTEYAVKWLDGRKAKGGPFCLYLSHKAVHGPFDPAPRHAGMYGDVKMAEPASWSDDKADKPAWMRDNRPMKQRKKQGPVAIPERLPPRPWLGNQKSHINYLEAIAAVDDSVGAVMRKLRELGVADDTVVVFTSDNGFFLGEHRRGDKRLAFEESVRIPMIVRYPKLVKAGSAIGAMALSVDVAPTLLDLAGVKTPPTMQGRSLVPVLGGKTPADWPDTFLYEYFREEPYPIPTITAVRTPRWKLVTYPETGELELYDLQADPHELENVAGDSKHAAKLAEMKSLLEAQKKATGFRMPQ